LQAITVATANSTFNVRLDGDEQGEAARRTLEDVHSKIGKGTKGAEVDGK